jgi:hypothetical protein
MGTDLSIEPVTFEKVLASRSTAAVIAQAHGYQAWAKATIAAGKGFWDCTLFA